MGFSSIRTLRILPVLAAVSLCAVDRAPRAETSPLSVLPEGFGVEVSGYNARERGMGEAGLASVNRQGPSIPNPSKTAFNEKTSFSATFDTDVDWLQDEDFSNRTTSFLIPDIALNFKGRWPVNLGLFYHQRYHRNFSYTPALQASPTTIESFTTEGGLYELAATLAYAPKPFLALALGYHFLIGRERTIEPASFTQNTNNEDLPNGEDLTGDTVSTRSSGGYPSLSATFRQKTWSLAAMGTLGTTLDRTFQRTLTNLTSAEKRTDERDLPWTVQAGVSYKPRINQTLAADIAYESWDDSYSSVLNPAFRVGTGYEFQGPGGPYEPYFRKVAYRGGLGFERLYLDETDLYFLTFGTGLPLGRRGNLLDVAIKYGHRGSLENNLWTEDFLKLSVTLTGVSVWGQPVRKRP
ncbi:MAG: hypothetical protein JWP91_4425 [Fibrobacteres bacterium]|nr:hypothetical protein [Fibrobacterota bacterium]